MSLVMARCRAETRTYHLSDYELMRYKLSQGFGLSTFLKVFGMILCLNYLQLFLYYLTCREKNWSILI